MFRSHSLSLPNLGSTDQVKEGTLAIPKGKGVVGLRCKLTIPLNNTSGGPVTLTDAQKRAVLSHLSFLMEVGASKQQPYKNLAGDKIRMLQRVCFGSEVENYTGTVNGLQTALPNAATTNVVCWLLVPTGRFWTLGQARNLFAMGRSQCRTVMLQLDRGGAQPAGLPAGVIISGTITADVQPHMCSMKGDRYSYLPEYREFTIRDFFHEYTDAQLAVLIAERTAVHASTTITKVNLTMDGEEIHRDISPADIITEYNDVPNLPAESQISDLVTFLYQWTPDRELRELPTGMVRVEQPNKDLADFLLAYYGWKVIKKADRDADLEKVANDVRKKTIKAVSVVPIDGLTVPSRLAAFMPAQLVDADDAEYHRFPGVGVPFLGKAEVYIPPQVLDAGKRAIAAAGSNDVLKDAVRRGLAATIPGASQSARGFTETSPIFRQIESELS